MFPPGEEPSGSPAGTPGPEREPHVDGSRVAVGLQQALHVPEVRVVARFLPGIGDGLVNERRLDVVHRASPAAHPPDHAREHRETLFPVIAVDLRGRRVDHGEGVKAR